MELGQLLISNTAPEKYEADWATDGLYMIAQCIAELRGKDPLGGWTTLTSNSGETEYENDIFYMSSYCWCEGGSEGHENGCPPNFIYKVNGMCISWYKHAGRGIRASREYPGARLWANAVMRCISSVTAYSDLSKNCDHMFVTPENKAKGICGRCGISFDEWHG
jgi:hypothetical protein